MNVFKRAVAIGVLLSLGVAWVTIADVVTVKAADQPSSVTVAGKTSRATSIGRPFTSLP